MRIYRARSRNTGLVGLFVVASLFLVTASPALSQGETLTGTGAGAGFEYPVGGFEPKPCFEATFPVIPPGEVPGDRFLLTHVGNFTAMDPMTGTAVAVYNGTTEVEIKVDTHVIQPEGVGPDCATPLGPVPIREAHVNSPNSPTGSVNCNYSEGFYTRRAFEVVTFLLTPGSGGNGNGTCEVQGPTGPKVGPIHTTIEITGTMTPCSDPFTGAPNPDCDVQGSDPGSHLETVYTATGA